MAARKAPSKQAPQERALKWWHKQVSAGHYVIPSGDTPEPAAARVLVRGGYAMEVAGRRAWILKTPDRTDLRDIFLANYWAVVRRVLEAYEPAAVTGLAAVNLHLGDASIPAALKVRHAASKSLYKLMLFEGFVLQLVPGALVEDDVVEVDIGGNKDRIAVEHEAATLLHLPVAEIEGEIKPTLAAWLRTLSLAAPLLRQTYRASPVPVAAERMAALAQELGNSRLAAQLRELLTEEYGHHISATKTGVGNKIVIPPHLAGLAITSGQPWLERQAAKWVQFAAMLREISGKREAKLASTPTKRLLAHARKMKSYDAYHSTTIEGYRITQEEADALLRGETYQGRTPADIAARTAIVGYGRAFDQVLASIDSGARQVSEKFILDLYADLFGPSVDAGVLSALDLRGWRRNAVQIRGSMHVPPNDAKVPSLMGQFVSLLNGTQDVGPVSRAALAHAEFAAIHPFMDGNGRISRLMMNFLLLGAGVPWVTIRNDERLPYFAALEKASVHDDIEPFLLFVMRYVREAIRELGRESRSGIRHP